MSEQEVVGLDPAGEYVQLREAKTPEDLANAFKALFFCEHSEGAVLGGFQKAFEMGEKAGREAERAAMTRVLPKSQSNPTEEEIERAHEWLTVLGIGFEPETERLAILLATVRAEGRAEIAREEREAVVKWLRSGAHLKPGTPSQQIERGDHLKGDVR